VGGVSTEIQSGEWREGDVAVEPHGAEHAIS
jgi:hypothetical protein